MAYPGYGAPGGYPPQQGYGAPPPGAYQGVSVIFVNLKKLSNNKKVLLKS